MANIRCSKRRRSVSFVSQKLAEFINAQPDGPDHCPHYGRVDGVVPRIRQHANVIRHHDVLALVKYAESDFFQGNYMLVSQKSVDWQLWDGCSRGLCGFFRFKTIE